MSKFLSKRNKKSDLYGKAPKVFRGTAFHEEMKEESALKVMECFSYHVIDKFSVDQLEMFARMGPKWCAKNKLFDHEGWRAGYTKPTLESRVYARRMKNRLKKKVN